jgi:hypothetical protein
MVPMDIGSFMDFGVSLDRVVLAAVVGVLILAFYEIAILVAALLATRASKTPARAGPRAGGAHPR